VARVGAGDVCGASVGAGVMPGSAEVGVSVAGGEEVDEGI